MVVKTGCGIGKPVSVKEKTVENDKQDEEMSRKISERVVKKIRQSRINQKKIQKTN